MREVTVSQLKSAGYQARDQNSILGDLDLNGQNVRGQCIEVSRSLKKHLIKQNGLSENAVEKVRCKVGSEIHYFVAVRSNVIEDINSDSGKTFIDASIDQFCDEQKEIDRVKTSFGSYSDLERVAVIPPSNER